MAENPTLTIAYTTFKRTEQIAKRIAGLSGKLSEEVELVVVGEEQADLDGWSALKALERKFRFSLYSGPGGGYASALFEAQRVSKGEYCLHLSDEDEIDPLEISGLLKWLKENQPDAAVLNFNGYSESPGSLFIRRNSTGKISPSDIWKCSHNPGSVFRVSRTLPILEREAYLSTRFETLLKFYPHLLLLAALLPDRNCWFYSSVEIRQVDCCRKLHKERPGERFNDPASRWKQHKDLVNWIESFPVEFDRSPDDVVELSGAVKGKLFDLLKTSLISQPEFDSKIFFACMSKYLLLRPFFLVYKLLCGRLKSIPLTKKSIRCV